MKKLCGATARPWSDQFFRLGEAQVHLTQGWPGPPTSCERPEPGLLPAVGDTLLSRKSRARPPVRTTGDGRSHPHTWSSVAMAPEKQRMTVVLNTPLQPAPRRHAWRRGKAAECRAAQGAGRSRLSWRRLLRCDRAQAAAQSCDGAGEAGRHPAVAFCGGTSSVLAASVTSRLCLDFPT